MIMPSDKVYKETKKIMLGKSSMKGLFRHLADWIDKTYRVKTINIFYDTFDKGSRPRLEICFEYESEKSIFLEKNNTNFDSEKQNSIALKFQETLEHQEMNENKIPFTVLKKGIAQPYHTENILIIYAAFEPVARIEANGSLAEDKVLNLKNELNNTDLWGISRCLSTTRFFLYTDEQVKQYEHSDIRKLWTDKYFELLKPYDELGYFTRDKFNISLDSKENFDNNFESNWFYYYK